MMYVPVQVCLKTGKDQYPSLKTVREREWVLSYLAFCSSQVFSRLDEAHHYLGWQSVLLSLLIQWLIVPQKHPHGPPRNNV